MMSNKDAQRASAIASLLLIAAEPLSSRTLCRVLEADRKEVESAVDWLAADLASSGIRLQIHKDRLQLATAPENAEVIRRYLELPRQPKLSRPSLETLSLIAYQQPVTRGELEQVRGVNVDRVVSNLLARGWIEETGRRQEPGRPIEYGTTN